MKKVLFLLAFFSLMYCVFAQEKSEAADIPGVDIPADKITFNGKKYKAVFFDDFNGTQLDKTKWEKCPEWERQNHDGKGCWWKKALVTVKDGNLVIEAKRVNGKNYSGGIRSNKLFEQNGGLYTFRFKADKANGLWYAIWLMSHSEDSIGKGAVDGGEIDIIEILPGPGKPYVNSAVHWDGYGSSHKSQSQKFPVTDAFYDEWHTLTFEWTKDSYKAYMDGSETPFWDSTKKGAEAWGGIVATANYMKITCEFGSWAGPVKEEQLPAHFYVDWVKVYK